MRAFSISLLAFLVAPLAAQQVIVVSGGGGALQAAAQQANPGDTLLVRPGSYSAVRFDKGISVLCDPGVTVFGSHPFVPIAVIGVPAGQTFSMRGGAALSSGFNFSLVVADSPGAAMFEGVGIVNVFVRDSAQVAFNGMGMTVATIQRASASFVECVMAGGTGDAASGAVVRATDASISVSGGSITGDDAQFIFPAMRAIHGTNSRITVTGSPATTIAAGNGGVPAIEVAGGELRVDPVVTLVAHGAPVIGGTGPVTQTPVPWVQAQSVASGQVFTETAHGEPGALLVVFANVPQQPLQSPFGDLWIGLPGFQIDAGVVPVGRTLSRSYVMPPLPRGATYAYQAVELLFAGPLVIGTATAVVLN